MPTLAPGEYLVPRWRTRMLPASTTSPPNFLTPSRRPGESRPLRELPPAFLCAMAYDLYAVRTRSYEPETLVILSTVRSWRWPFLRREFWRRRFLKMMTLGPR